MKKRPLPVTVISCVLVATGILGLAFHMKDFGSPHPFQFDVAGIILVRLTAVVCGAFMLRGNNWARWLAMAWIACHVAIGALHSLQQLLIHCLVFAIFAYFLFRPAATEYFRARRPKAE